MSKNRMKNNVKTAKGRKISSTEWLRRQLNDPYVARAKEEGYRSRAAFKLIEIDDKFSLLKKASGLVIDLGSAPGSWLQVIKKRAKPCVKVIGIDLKSILHVEGTEFIQGDFLEKSNQEKIFNIFGASVEERGVDLVLSDMAADACGSPVIDHLRVMNLVSDAAAFALACLKTGGSFACKVLQGEGEKEFTNMLKKHFKSVSFFKPGASRKDSAEIFVIARYRK